MELKLTTRRKKSQEFEHVQTENFLECISDIFFGLDHKLKFIYFNNAAENYFRRKRDDVAGKSITSIFPEVKNSLLEKNCKIALKHKQLRKFETQLSINSFCQWCSISVYPFTGGILIYISLTENNKYSDKNFSGNEEKHHRYFGNGSLGVSYYTPDGNVVSFDKFVAGNVADKPDIVTKENIKEIFPSGEARKYLKRLQECAKSDKILEYEDKVDFPDGTKWVASTCSKIFYIDKNTPVIQVIFKDITDKKEIESELAESEQKFRALFYGSPDFVAITLLDGKILDVNDGVYRVTGYRREEVLNKTVFDIKSWIIPEHRDIFVNELKEHGFIDNLESSFLCFGGIAKTGIISAQIVHIKGIPHVISVIRDIDERKKTEIELEQKNKFIQTILDNLPIGIALNKTDNGQATYINKKFEEIYGWPADELKNISTFFERVYPDENYRKEIMSRVLDDIQSGDPKRMHWENISIVARNGKTKAISAVNIPLIEQNTMISTVIDITRLKNTERALRESEKNMNVIFNSTPLIMMLVDENHRVVKINKAGLRITEKKVKEIVGLKAGNVLNCAVTSIKPEDCGKMKDCQTCEIKKTIKDTLQNGISHVKVEAPITLQKKGKFENFILIISSIRINIKEKMYAVVTIDDITDRIKIEEEIIRAKEKAEKSDRLKSAFIANMSHEIRTPLNGVMGFSELITKENITSSQRERYATLIRNSSKHLIKIIDDILNISLIESGELNVVLRQFSVNYMLNEIYTLFNLHLEEQKKSNVNLILKRESKDLNIISDETRLMEIFSNILDNAIKFTHSGFVEFGVYKSNQNNITFFVRDTGIGIEEKDQGYIFERFRQADVDDERCYGGNGLGLSIAKSMVYLLGGNIWMESSPGKGTTFFFTIHNHRTDSADQDQNVSEKNPPA